MIVGEYTDRSKTKHVALITRTAIEFNVKDNFLRLLPITDGCAITLHKESTEYFNIKNIPCQKNMIGYASDGAKTMFGKHHSLCTLFSEEIPHLFKIKCICHSFHLCASYACEKLPRRERIDNGPPFSSHKFTRFGELNGIKMTKARGYHPESNGLAEKEVQTAKNALKKYLLDPRCAILSIQNKIDNFVLSYWNAPWLLESHQRSLCSHTKRKHY